MKRHVGRDGSIPNSPKRLGPPRPYMNNRLFDHRQTLKFIQK